jgi:hypothetical protein
MQAANQQDKGAGHFTLPMAHVSHHPSKSIIANVMTPLEAPVACAVEGGVTELQQVKSVRAPVDPKDSKVLGNPMARIMAKGAYLVDSNGLQKRSISIILPSGRKMYIMNYFKEDDKNKLVNG